MFCGLNYVRVCVCLCVCVLRCHCTQYNMPIAGCHGGDDVTIGVGGDNIRANLIIILYKDILSCHTPCVM